jgi:hypothetical protein
MGKLTNLNPAAPIADSDIPPNIARDEEYIAADTAHVNATHPHSQYLLPSEGDARYRQQLGTQTFSPTNKSIALSTGAVKEATAQTINKTGLEVQATDNLSAAYVSFHRPNAYGCHFGLDTNNTLTVGGWSFGNVAYKLWHELYGTPVWQAPSDRRLKKNIRSIPSALQLILETQPVSFSYTAVLQQEHFADKFQRKKTHYGFLADDFPLQDLVSEKSNGFLGVDYLEIIPFLCRAIQEQQEQLHNLQNQIDSLKA